MEDRDVRQRFRATGDRNIEMAEGDLVGGIGDRLVGRSTGAADRECLHSFRKLRHQRDFACDVRRYNRRNDGPEHQTLYFLSVQIRALEKLGDAELPEVDCGY